MMAGGYAACLPARKKLQAGACGGKDRAALRAAPCPLPPLTQMVYTDSGFTFLSEDVISGLNLAATSEEEQDKVPIDLTASGVAYKERLAMSVVAEPVVREPPEHLREFFMERLRHYRKLSVQLPDKNAPEYAKNGMALKNSAIADAE